MKPVRQCEHAGCTVLVPYDVKYCTEHKKQAEKQRYSYRIEREGKNQRFYKTTAWRKLSHNYLLANPLCEWCLKDGIMRKAEIVDHIEPIRDDWSKRLDRDNLRSLCNSCHWKRHHNKKAF